MVKAILPALLILTIVFFNCSNNGNAQQENNNEATTSKFVSSVDDDNAGDIPGKKSNEKIARDADIPAWYKRNKVQVITALRAEDINKPYFLSFSKTLADAGATVVTRAIKHQDEQPWWPSKYGTELPAAKVFDVNGKNLAKDIIDGMHAVDMHSIIYYRHQEDSQMYVAHPDWACLDIKGTAIKTPRGIFLSLNSPYRNVLIQRIKELAQYGADGFIFDEVQIPIAGDFSKYSQNLYKQQFNSNLIADYKNGDIKKFYDFRNQSIQNFFDDLRDTLQAANLNKLIIVSGNSWPTFNDLHLTSNFYKNYTLKSEVEVPNRIIKKRVFTMPESIKQIIPAFYNIAFDFSFCRDNTLGPPYIWAPEISEQKDAESICAGLISLGCNAELAINPSHKNTDVSIFKTVFQWNKSYGNYFEKMVPYAVTGVVVSEKQRNQFIGDATKAWTTAMLPPMKAFEKLYQNGIPVRLISDAQIKSKNTQQLKNVYVNKSLPLPVGVDVNSLSSLQDLPNLDGLALAQKLGSPIFCKKDNEFTHVNYFTDADGYLYVVTAPDFNSVRKAFNEKGQANLAYKQGANYNAPTTMHVYIKTDNNASGNLQDLVNNMAMKSSKNESGYTVYDIKPNASSLGLYRFKLK